jgi:hypothetical protein
MGRSKHKTTERFVMLRHWILNTPAWRDLDAVSRAVYIEISRRYMGQNNGRIPYSVREGAAELRVSKATISRSMKNLVEHRFLVTTKKGAFSLKARHATEWRLTEYDCDNILATKDFVRWSPPVPEECDNRPVVGRPLLSAHHLVN